ncbi:MAG: PqqD family peptide modification chaperone, partial [Clostridia bacterium]|nr:PqqD family peptide modification chaperone [Clostridia bacterium]
MIHQYKLNGYNIVLDIASGSVHAVDEVAYDIIGMYGKTETDEIVKQITEKYGITEKDVLSCIDDIEKLRNSKQLFCEDIYADKADMLKNKNNVIKALCLHVSHTCNLNCSYCFAGQGKYSGDRAVMSLEVGKRAIDFLIENSGDRKNLEVDFFGGEPLMNFETVKEIVKYARSIEKKHGKNFRFTLTTNGVLLDDEVTDFC